MCLLTQSLRTLCNLRPHLRLSVRNLWFPQAIPQHAFGPRRFQSTTTLPAANITSIYTMVEGYSTTVSPIQDLLIGYLRLEVLELYLQPTPFIRMSQRLPPILELVLRDDKWIYSPRGCDPNVRLP